MLNLRSDLMVYTPLWCSFQLEKYLRDPHRPAFFTNEANFLCHDFEGIQLSPGAQRIKELPNAGGSSLCSEVVSFEVLRRTLQARLLKTEMELKYCFANSKITDYSVGLFDHTIGVSVTRALRFHGRFTMEDAQRLLAKKLSGVLHSTSNVLDDFHKQILHVWAKSHQVARVLRAAYCKVDPVLRANTVVVVTVVQNADWIFFERGVRRKP